MTWGCPLRVVPVQRVGVGAVKAGNNPTGAGKGNIILVVLTVKGYK